MATFILFFCHSKIEFLAEMSGTRLSLYTYNCFKNIDIFLDQLKAICKEYYDRIQKIESEKWELERHTTVKDQQVRIVYSC